MATLDGLPCKQPSFNESIAFFKAVILRRYVEVEDVRIRNASLVVRMVFHSSWMSKLGSLHLGTIVRLLETKCSCKCTALAIDLAELVNKGSSLEDALDRIQLIDQELHNVVELFREELPLTDNHVMYHLARLDGLQSDCQRFIQTLQDVAGEALRKHFSNYGHLEFLLVAAIAMSEREGWPESTFGHVTNSKWNSESSAIEVAAHTMNALM